MIFGKARAVHDDLGESSVLGGVDKWMKGSLGSEDRWHLHVHVGVRQQEAIPADEVP